MSISKFSTVGLLNTVAGLLVIYAGKSAGLSDIVSNFIGYAFGIILGFYLNSTWAFGVQTMKMKSFLLYIVVVLVAYCINLSVVMASIVHYKIDAYLAQALGVIPYSVVSYLGFKYFAFARTV